jgi:hypothetical protein
MIGENGTLIQCWWECKVVQLLWKTIWRFLKKLNKNLPYDAEIPVLGIYPKECNSGYSRGTFTPMNVTKVIPKSPAHPCLLQHYSQ